MGDLRAWSPEPTAAAAVPEERPSSSSSSSVSSSAIRADYWQRAEAATLGIIAQVQPTPLSEDRRKAVIDYVQRLIRKSVGCEVFPFGSVPLKTYLPDGDIDLTAFGGMNVEEALANEVFSVLEKEDQSTTAEFVVKDVQLIRAEVKLVKCLVQNIVVDISFNQLGGLCTLCFLEKVDRLIGKNNLFKRSIILIKSWCYYESRILGAHHGLISTYALETLVLYIFHLFHSTLRGPLAVLYKFLDYFSKFEWDTYCISLNGPVRISSLPDFVVEPPENGGCDLLLSSEFIKECLEMFSAPSRGFETNSRTFQPKHLNIVDPLKENNNLGRSVSKGNFYRIRSAFTYGARKLGRILSQPEENVADELHKFFTNTLDRHGSGQRPDVQDALPMDGQYGLSAVVHFSGREPYQEDETTCESDSTDSNGGFSVKVSSGGVCLSQSGDESQSSANGIVVSEKRLVGDAKDLATSRAQGLSISISSAEFKASSRSVGSSLSPVAKPFHAPHLYFSHPVRGNGEMGDGNPGEQQTENGGFSLKRISSGIVPTHSEDTTNLVYTDPDDNQFIGNHEVLSPAGLTNHPWCSADHFFGHSGNRTSSGSPVNLKVFNPLLDLSGDYDSHLNSLHHGRRWFEYAANVSFSPMSQPLLPQFRSKTSWDVVRLTYRRNAISQGNVNGVAPRQVFYPINPPLIPGPPFGVEEMPKPRGTGTYFPNANHYRDRSLTAKGRNQAPSRSPRNNGRLVTSQETTFPDRDGRETSQAQFHINQGGGKSGSSDPHSPGTPDGKMYSTANGVMHLPESVVEFGSIGHLSLATPLVDNGGRQSNPASPTAPSSGISPTATGMQRPKSVSTVDQDRIAMQMQSFRLKDEDDFPPLSDSSGKGVPIYVVKKVEKDEQ